MNDTGPGGPGNGHGNGQEEPSDIIVLTPGATELEIAAATAVLEGVLKELAADAAEPAPSRIPWQQVARKLREPIGPGHPGWGEFSG